MPAHLDNEAVLVAEAQAGDAEAFTTLVNQYDRNIYRMALSISGNEADAEDVLQETFLKAYMKLGQFRGQSRFYTWLVRIAVNESLMKVRRQRRNRRMVSLDEPIQTGEDEVLPRQIVDWNENPEKTLLPAGAAADSHGGPGAVGTSTSHGLRPASCGGSVYRGDGGAAESICISGEVAVVTGAAGAAGTFEQIFQETRLSTGIRRKP